MRTSAAALAAAWLVACGGAQHAPKPDDCAAYDQAVRAPLGRMANAADRFSDALGRGPDAAVPASRDFARVLDEERAELGALHPERPDVADAHERMLAALGGLADAIRFLGEVVGKREEGRREEARGRMARAERGWEEAVARVKRVCPQAALP